MLACCGPVGEASDCGPEFVRIGFVVPAVVTNFVLPWFTLESADLFGDVNVYLFQPGVGGVVLADFVSCYNLVSDVLR